MRKTVVYVLYVLVAAMVFLRSQAATLAGTGTLEFIPASRDAQVDCTALLVWAHGLGDSHKGWSSTMKVLQRRHRHVCIALPTAPEIPITFAQGRVVRAWYDFDGTEIHNASKEGDADRITASAQYLHKIALDFAKKNFGKVSFRRVAIGGFSQGAVVTMHAALTSPKTKCAGGIAVAGYLAGSGALTAKAARGVRKGNFHYDAPILLLHGKRDDRVPPTRSELAQTRLRELGVADVKLRLFENVAHGMDDDMLNEISEFLNRVLPTEDANQDL